MLASFGAAISVCALAACGNSPSASSSAGTGGEQKLVIVAQGWPCALNGFVADFCKGVQAASKDAPKNVTVQLKTAASVTNQDAYNAVLENATLLHPAVIAAFGGNDAQVPPLKKACDKGVKVVIADQDLPSLECRTSTVGADFAGMGVQLAKWTQANGPAGPKKIGLLGFSPGTVPAVELGYKAFKDYVTTHGDTIAGEVTVPCCDQDAARTAVENLLTAHPEINVFYSSNDALETGIVAALKSQKKQNMFRVSTSGDLAVVPHIVDGTGLSANVAKSAYLEGYETVMTAIAVANGQTVEKFVKMPTLVIDKSNAKQFIADPGGFLKANGSTS